MPRRHLGISTFDAALDRLIRIYESGDTPVVSFSGGKDSGVCVELSVIAATMTDRLPVHVVMRDEEIMFPGTFEYAERVAARPEIDFHWVIANQPIVNVCNRENPYWWVFDPLVDPDDWVRKPPDIAYTIPEINIEALVTPERFPVADGHKLWDVIGLRGAESFNRLLGIHSSKGYVAKPKRAGGPWRARPIYDWTDGDVWKAILDNGWDYNRAYDDMIRAGLKGAQLRIGPPTLNVYAIPNLQAASRLWPYWFDRVCDRLEGVRTVAKFGKRAVEPERRMGESWEETFKRECIETAPVWIAARSERLMNNYLQRHIRHATTPLPEVKPCQRCDSSGASWKKMALHMYNGDAFGSKYKGEIGEVEPEFFREGAGTWGGSASW